MNNNQLAQPLTNQPISLEMALLPVTDKEGRQRWYIQYLMNGVEIAREPSQLQTGLILIESFAQWKTKMLIHVENLQNLNDESMKTIEPETVDIDFEITI